MGAPPQFVKSAVVERALAQCDVQVLGVPTGQHYDEQMSEVFFRQFGNAEPYVNLGIGSASHGLPTGQMVAAIESRTSDPTPSSYAATPTPRWSPRWP